MKEIKASLFYKIVTEPEIDKAIQYIDENPNSIPKKNESTKHLVLAKNGKLYPPKQLLRITAKLKKLKIDENGFSGGGANKPFEDLGYEIIHKNNIPSNKMKTIDLKNHKVYKLSMGTFIKDSRYKHIDPIKMFEEKGLIVMSKITGNGQGENFKTKLNIGDYVYVTYGFTKLSNVYRITSDYSIANNKTEVELDDEWICREVELIQESIIQNTSELKTNYKAWLPSGYTTFVEITDIPKANEILFNKYYNLNFKKSIMRDLKSEFAEWLIKNPRVDYFNNNKKKIESILDEYNTFFDVDIFKCSIENYKEIQNLILQKLYEEESNDFLEFSLKDSNHRPRAIIGKSNYLKFLNEIFGNAPQEKGTKQSDINENSHPLNTILYGPPGTGKTYTTKELAVNLILGFEERTREEILEKYNELQKKKQITFTTFHQSISYEDFIEGIKPVTVNENVTYEVKNGIFKNVCTEANKTVKKTVKFDNNDAELNPELFKEYYISFVSQLQNQNEVVDSNYKLKTPTGKTFELFKNSSNSIIIKAGTKEASMSLSLNELSKVYFENKEPTYKSYSDAVINKILENLEVETLPFDNLNEAFVLIIDEINRGNISSIFGELITLLEEDKRKGNKEEIEVILPYSKEKFSVPSNLYIIGTMNTADRSVEALDTALRRRFSFTEIQYNPDVIEFEHPTNGIVTFEDEKIDLITLLNTINERIEMLIDKDHKIGHSYFLNVTNFEDLSKVFTDKVIPLLEEYFFGDFGKIGLVLGSAFIIPVENGNKVKFATNFKYDDKEMLREKSIYKFTDKTEWNADSFLSIYSEN
jgi:Cdc6-like AAA superfamily ATPase